MRHWKDLIGDTRCLLVLKGSGGHVTGPDAGGLRSKQRPDGGPPHLDKLWTEIGKSTRISMICSDRKYVAHAGHRGIGKTLRDYEGSEAANEAFQRGVQSGVR